MSYQVGQQVSVPYSWQWSAREKGPTLKADRLAEIEAAERSQSAVFEVVAVNGDDVTLEPTTRIVDGKPVPK